ELVTGDEPLDGAAVEIEDGSRAAAVPSGLLQNQLQVAALELLHAGTVGDQAMLGMGAARGFRADGGDLGRQAIDGDQPARGKRHGAPQGVLEFPDVAWKVM